MLNKDVKVKIPSSRIKMVPKGNGGPVYIYYVDRYYYDKKKKYSSDKRIIIGKKIDDEYMIPNDNFLKYFPERASELISDAPDIFSDTLHVGVMSVIDKILNDTGVGTLLDSTFDDSSQLIKDIISYMIVEESSKYEDFPYFEREHNTFTSRVYSDSTVSDLLRNEITPVKIKFFLDSWNKINSDIEDVYINVDATNINVTNEFEGLGEYGKAKDDESLPQVNITYMSKAIDNTPLNYSLYHGSVNDAAEFKFIIRDINRYGYKNVGFIMDRIYYSKDTYEKLIKEGYSILCALKGNLDFVKNVYNECSIKLKDMVTCYIGEHEVSGVTKKVKLNESGKKNVYGYVHMFYSDKTASLEREAILQSVYEYEKSLRKLLDENKDLSEADLKKYSKWFRFKTEPSTKAVYDFVKKTSVIEEELKKCGYFTLLSSKKMEAKDALDIYSQRDGVEKLFRTLKTSMDFDHVGVHSRKSLEAKVFITFVASIVRNEIFKGTRKLDSKLRKTYTVPVTVKELETIEATKNSDNTYYRRYVLTAKQKKLLSLFELSETNIDESISKFNRNRK